MPNVTSTVVWLDDSTRQGQTNSVLACAFDGEKHDAANTSNAAETRTTVLCFSGTHVGWPRD